MLLLSVNLVYSIDIEIVPFGGVDVKLYVVALDGVDAGGVGNITRMVDGVLEASYVNFTRQHVPDHGTTYAEIGINTEVSLVQDWSEYKEIVETSSNVVIVNSHGETLPVPSGYTKEEWADKIAEAMAYRNVTWVHTAGYPLYYYCLEQGGEGEWNERGFQRLMSHLGKGNVTCWPPGRQSEKFRMHEDAEYNIMHGWYDIALNAFRVECGRPLNASDFQDCRVAVIWGTEDQYMTGAILKFAEASDANGFGFYVHIGTYQTYTSDNVPTDADYTRGYVGAGAGIWACAWRFVDEEAISKAEAAIAKAESERRTNGIDEAKTLVQEAKSSVPSLKAVLEANKAADLSNKASRPIIMELYALSLVVLGAASVATAIGLAMKNNRNFKKKSEQR
jgi:hypothetical protein